MPRKYDLGILGPIQPIETGFRVGIGLRGHEGGFRVRPGNVYLSDGWVLAEGVTDAERDAFASWVVWVRPELGRLGARVSDLLPFEDVD